MTFFSDLESHKVGFDPRPLSKLIASAQASVKLKLETIKDKVSSISIADMFDMQVLMNRLSQFSEMSTNVLAAANTALQSLSRNVKG